MFDGQFPGTCDEPFLWLRVVPLFARNPIRIASQRIGLRHAIQKIKLALARETTKRALPDLFALLVELARLHVAARAPASLNKLGRGELAAIMAERTEHARHEFGVREVV